MTIKQSNCIVLLLGFLLLVPPAARAAEPVAELVSLTGKVDILRDGKVPSEEARVGAQLFVGDFIRTKSKANAEVLFKDGNRIKIAERSRVDISTYSADKDQRTLGLARGKMEAVVIPGADNGSERPKRFEIETPNAVAGVRGTTLVVAFQDSITAIHVREAHSGRSVYSISRHHPNQIVNVPVGGMMWVSHQGPPTLMLPGAEPGLTILAESLSRLDGLADLQVLVDGLSTGGQLPPIFSETFPEALGVEVGMVSMSGATTTTQGYNLSIVNMDTHFYAITPDAVPFYWQADTVNGTWSNAVGGPPFNLTGESLFISGGTTGEMASANMTFSSWDSNSGSWTASIDSGFGEVPNGSTFYFDGSASGTGATDLLNGTFTGAASGVAIDNSIIIGQ